MNNSESGIYQTEAAIAGVFLGVAAVDIVYLADYPPGRNTKNIARRQAVYAGGPATNASVTFAGLGGRASLAVIAGRHVLAYAIKEDLARHNVSLIDLCPEFSGHPIFSSVIVDEASGDRMVMSANTSRLPEPATVDVLAQISDACVVLLDGHLIGAATRLARQARERKIPVVFDGGSWKEGTEQLLPFVDAAICSDDFRTPGASSATDTIACLHQHGIPRCAVTRGRLPVLFSAEGETGEIDVPKVKAVDTLGAGDVFHGAFCYYYGASESFTDALKHAAAVASFSCRFFGTRDWIAEYRKSPDI